MQDDARAFGIVIGHEPEIDEFPVLPQNEEMVIAFLRIATQWRYTQGVRVGLDYTACKVALDAEGFDIRRVFSGLQVMEVAVLDVVNQKLKS